MLNSGKFKINKQSHKILGFRIQTENVFCFFSPKGRRADKKEVILATARLWRGSFFSVEKRTRILTYFYKKVNLHLSYAEGSLKPFVFSYNFGVFRLLRTEGALFLHGFLFE